MLHQRMTNISAPISHTKINSFDTAPKKLLSPDARLRPDRFALEEGDMAKSGAEKSRLECGFLLSCVGL